MAGTILAAVSAITLTAIGVTIRGPYAEDRIIYDLMTGAGVTGIALAAKWAIVQFEQDAVAP